MTDWFRWDGEALLLNLRVQPGARCDEFAGANGNGQYRVRIHAPPVEGKANKHLAAFLAREFGVAKSAVDLVSGKASRDKRFRIQSPAKLPPFLTEKE
ncbi:MAG: DUF167 family protein [Chromatiales bacterium]